jgi:serine/threonine protein kinase
MYCTTNERRPIAISANVLLDEQGQLRVTDFGLAKRVPGESDLTRSGQILGTPSYMPPEQALGKLQEIEVTADVYALGAILYALLTGRSPFQADNQLDTLLRVVSMYPQRPETALELLSGRWLSHRVDVHCSRAPCSRRVGVGTRLNPRPFHGWRSGLL